MAEKLKLVKLTPPVHSKLISTKKVLHKKNPKLERSINNSVVVDAALKALKKSGYQFSLRD